MRHKLMFLLVLSVILIIGLSSTAFAADGNGDTYDDNDFDKLRDFLEQDIDGSKNGHRLNPSYNSVDPATWTGVLWNDETPKRIVSIGRIAGEEADVYNWQYTGLKGTLDVSDFAALAYLNCAGNELTSLNVSNDAALAELYCNENQLAALDVSSNTALTQLLCQNNQLASLATGNAPLHYLSCGNNLLTTLDVSTTPLLTHLFCNGNLLTALNTSTNPNLMYVNFCDNRLQEIIANFSGRIITLTANTGGYVELFGSTDEAILNANAVPQTGKAFYNWTAGGTPVSSEAAYPLTDGNDTLIATFAYLVTYDKNGGHTEANPATQLVLFGDMIGTPPIPPTRTGYTFGGWYREPACTTEWDFASDSLAANTTLYAKWVRNSSAAAPNVTINQTAAAFDPYNQQDILIGFTGNGSTLQSIKNGESALINGVDYSVSGSSIVLKKEYLAKLPLGVTVLTFVLSSGETKTLTITIEGVASESIPATGDGGLPMALYAVLAAVALSLVVFYWVEKQKRKV